MRATIAAAVACTGLVGITCGNETYARVRQPTNIAAQELGRGDLHKSSPGGGSKGQPDQHSSGDQKRQSSSAFRVVRADRSASSAALDGQVENNGNPDSSDRGNEDRGGLEEVVVTAQKRTERANDVPLSITAASGDQLTRLGITDTSQLEKIVPGFTFQTSQYGTPIYTIRGVGFFDNSVGAGPAVTAYTDQVPLPFAVMTRGAAFDLERVEVLKGPQGTLFGQNSTGGAINYVAAKPTDTLEAGVDLGYGRFNDVDVQGFISGPITDKLTARLALRGEHADGWQRSVTRPDDRLGAQRFVNSRLLVDFEPSDTMRFEFGANAWEDRSDSQAPQFMEFIPGVPPNPSNQYIVDALSVTSPAPADNRAADWRTDFDYENDKRFYQFYLNGAAELSSTVTATSITAYSNYRQNGAQAVDGSAFGNLTLVDNSAQLTSVSQELRLNGGSQPLRWMVGANYQDDESDEDQPTYYQSMSGSILGIVTHTGSFINHQWARTRSAFGSVDYDLNDTVTLQASARYSEQDRRFAGCFVDSGDGVTASAFSALSNLVRGFLEPPGFTPTAIAPGGCVTLNADYTPINGLIHDELNEDNVSWRGSINWKPNTDSLFYANVTKGYKAGSFTIAPAVQASQYFPAKQESVLAYETGFKLGLARRRVQLNGAAFYYDYGDKQVQASAPDPFAGNLNRLVNVPESRIYGAELEATIRPVEPLRLLAGVTFVDSQVQSDPQPPSEAFDPLGNPTTFVGNVFPNTPKWQGVADAEYTYPASNGVNLTFGGTLTYRSSAYAALGQLPNFKIPGYALLDLRAGIESADGVWQVQLYGRNVTDKYYYNGVYRAIDVLSRVTGRPATYGVHLLYRY